MDEELTGTEEVAMSEVFEGLADDINEEIDSLLEARTLAITFEGGLDTQAAINKTSVALRNLLFATKKNCHGLYAEVINIKATLLEGVGEVQKVASKEKLQAQIKEMEAKLSEM